MTSLKGILLSGTSDAITTTREKIIRTLNGTSKFQHIREGQGTTFIQCSDAQEIMIKIEAGFNIPATLP
ncbi:MAG: hypothetical protein P4L53_17125 [Candidatus Obscuribacterales bacterium]|nr:hypothetical protein [Candidatus Obscuribacterales bacterium]